MSSPVILDCTLRDGGYYNAWDFPREIIAEYLTAMSAAQVDIVEMGFRFLKNVGFKGPCAYATDDFLRNFTMPSSMTLGVMVNGSDLHTDIGWEAAIKQLFPETAETSPVQLVRFACHYHELPNTLLAVKWLSDRGYRVGFNLMQIADRTQEEIENLGRMAREYPVEVLYFADSMGSMTPDDTAQIVGWLRKEWDGPLGIHTHDNMGLALSNTLRAVAEGVTWLDATITGMGRGPGNARTEELVIEAEEMRGRKANLVPLMEMIRRHFRPMKEHYGWGTNPYYYLSGKYGIHPTYVQEMLGDSRYDEEDIFAVLDHLRQEGGKKFSLDRLLGARNFYSDDPRGTWKPADMIAGRDVLLLGTGPGVAAHRPALEAYIRREKPLVLALNTQSAIDSDLIDLRAACHPVRLRADCDVHPTLPQPLITPVSVLPDDLREALSGKELLDFGLTVQNGTFEFYDTYCVTPTPLVVAYALAVLTSGKANRVLMVGFDGYPAGDPRNDQMSDLLDLYRSAGNCPPLLSVGPTTYKSLPSVSIYGL